MSNADAAALMWEAGKPIAEFLGILAVLLLGLAIMSEI